MKIVYANKENVFMMLNLKKNRDYYNNSCLSLLTNELLRKMVEKKAFLAKLKH